MKITKHTTDLKIGSVLKVIEIEEHAPFELGKFCKITNGDCVGAYEINEEIAYQYTINELGNYFEYIATLEDIEDLEKKALILKETFEQLKIMSESAKEEISHEALINETIAFLVQDEVYKGDEIELRFICDNMDITMVEKCSCCGKFLMPDDECYSDDLNDGAALCDHCSVFNEDTSNYQKAVHQDVIEKITGLKFSPHLGNVGSTVEEFNHWLNRYKLAFSYSEESSKQNFLDFINGCTEFNICDCCGLIEKPNNLKWFTSIDSSEEENVATNFVHAVLNVDTLCKVCFEEVAKRTKLDLHEIVQRIRENQMVFRKGDLIVLKEDSFDEKNISNRTYLDYIVSIDENKKTYKLKEYGDIEFNEDDFFDIANEAYVSEYTKFIASQHPDLSEDVDQWSKITHEGIPEIEMAFEEFGFKDEFIVHLKINDLPYGRLLTTKNNIGELELEKQESSVNEELDESLIVKNELLEYIFCQDVDNNIVIPTYNQLTDVDDYQSNWKLTEEYGDYSLSTLVYLVNEESSKFFSIQKVLNGHKEKFRKSKKYGFRETVEFGTHIEIIEVFQNLHKTADKKELNGEPEMIVLQSSISTKDFSSIEIVLDCDIDYSALSKYLKKEVEQSFYKEVNMLIEVIKEAKYDKHNTLHLYDC